MATIPEDYVKEQAVHRNIAAFFKGNNLCQLLRKINAYKSRGIPVVQVIQYLVQLAFTHKSMYMNMLNGTNAAGFARDVVYRLLNAPYINWSFFLLNLAAAVTGNIASLTGGSRLNALIVDDTMYERLRSKKVELLANVYDHAAKGKNKFKRGFRLLTMGWSDGVTFIPLLYRHMSSAEKENRYNEISAKLDKRSVGYRIRQEAVSKSTDVLLSMLKQVKKIGIASRHVVFDSWFSFPATMISIVKVGFDVVGRLKNTPKIKYMVNGQKQTLKGIYAANKKRRGRAKCLLSTEVLLYNGDGETLPARIIFVRDRNNRKKWVAFACTDMTLTEEQAIQLYGKRWDIEVFFKVCKSYLNLAREFQGLSYDCVTAHTAIVMTRYIILAVNKRQNEDPRSLGELFFLTCDELQDTPFADVLARILTLLHAVLEDCLTLTDQQIDDLLDRFIAKFSECFKLSLPQPCLCA